MAENCYGVGPQSLPQQAANFQSFIDASRSGSKVFYGPLYSAVNLLGLAVAATAVLAPTSLPYFQASEGMQGQGWPRPLRFSETNLDGAPGQLPAGWAYAAHSLAVWAPPQMPPHIKDWLTRHTSLRHVRHTHKWEAGASQFWPEGLFGHQSQSVSSTVANTLIQFGVNGRCGARQFPQGAEIYFPPKEVIKFEIETYEPVTCTVDGLPPNGGIFGIDPGGNEIDPLDGLPLFVVLEGWRFEALTA